MCLTREADTVSKKSDSLIGLVLAGGQSRRMGRDKALMRYQGRTLIEHASLLLQSASCEHVLISRNAPGFLGDLIEDAGPLGGVHAALNFLDNAEDGSSNHSELLVLPVDMPQMTPQLLNTLVSKGREVQRACYVENRFLPFYLPITLNTKTSLAHYLVDQSKRRVVGFLDRVNAISLEEVSLTEIKTREGDHNEKSDGYGPNKDNAQWLNVNTPGDWPHEK